MLNDDLLPVDIVRSPVPPLPELLAVFVPAMTYLNGDTAHGVHFGDYDEALTYARREMARDRAVAYVTIEKRYIRKSEGN